MADQRTMAEFLRAPTEGYAKAIVVPPILADQFEIMHSLINMMITDQFFGLEKDNPHDHISWFNKITSTIKYKDVPNSAIKLMLFPFSLAGVARRWLEKEPPRSIHTWEDLDRYKDLVRACPHHGFTELHQLDTFYNALNPADQDSLNAVVGGNLLERRTQDVLTIIENKSKVRNSRNKSVVSQVKSCDANSKSSSEIAKLTHADNQQTSDVTTAMTAILKQFQATPPPASVKADEEICVTCGGAHPYYQCLAAGANTFPELRDNIQGYVSAATVNYNQGNSVYRPQEQSYQAPTQQNQIVPLNELEKVKRMNEANMKSMQTQINMVKNELRNEMKILIQASLSNQTNKIKNMMASLFQMTTAYTSGSGSLPSNTVANPKGELKAITTQSSLVINGPTVPTPPPFINLEEDERVEETLTDPDLSKCTIKVPPPLIQKYKPSSQSDYSVHQRDPLHLNIPYPSRMLKQKQQEKDEKMLKALLSNKEKLQELANTLLNENCSAVILKKLPEKLRDPGKFLIPCGFSELKCKALVDLGASINLMPLSVWKKLGLPELISTRMTLELANRAICTPAGIARDVFVPVGNFTFPVVFVIVDYESDPRVPLILGRPFLRIARALIDVHDFLEDLFSSQPSGNPTFLSHPELTSPEVKNDIFDLEGGNVLPKKFLDLDSTKDLHPPLHFDIEFDLKEIEFLLHQDIDSSLKDSIDQSNLANNFVDSMPEMFTDEHVPDYSSPPIFDKYDDIFLEVESNTENVYDDPFDSKGEKIKESKLLIDELDLPCDFLPPSKYDLFISQDFSRVDALPSTNNEEKDFDPPFYEPLFFKEVPSIPENLKPHAEGFCRLSLHFLNFIRESWNGYDKKGQNPNKTGQNRAQNGKRGKVNSQKYKDLLRACLHHGFTELHQLDTFYNALNPADQDSLNAAAGGILLERRTQDVLMIIENKSKVRNSRKKLVFSQVKSCDANSNSSSEIAKLTHAVNQQTSAVTTVMTAILKQFQATPPLAFVKAVEEICVTYGGAHPYYQCLAAGANTFPELQDNIQ
nr:hypothetical protein [Tanacetum cinerariifolium]